MTLLRLCGEMRLPVLFHCGDDPYTTPEAIALAAEAAPECSVILGHMGGYFHVEAAIDAAVRHGNIYLETSAMPYPAFIAMAVDRVGADRVLFGSDGPGCNPKLELDKIRTKRLEPEVEARLLGYNAVTLLGLHT